MNLRDVLRRFRLPRIASSQNRIGETEDAINLARILGERFSVGSEGVRFASRSAYRNSWVDWRDSLRELGVELRHIGRRGHASLKNGKQGRRDTGTGIQTRYLGPAGGQSADRGRWRMAQSAMNAGTS